MNVTHMKMTTVLQCPADIIIQASLLYLIQNTISWPQITKKKELFPLQSRTVLLWPFPYARNQFLPAYLCFGNKNYFWTEALITPNAPKGIAHLFTRTEYVNTHIHIYVPVYVVTCLSHMYTERIDYAYTRKGWLCQKYMFHKTCVPFVSSGSAFQGDKTGNRGGQFWEGPHQIKLNKCPGHGGLSLHLVDPEERCEFGDRLQATFFLQHSKEKVVLLHVCRDEFLQVATSSTN